MRDILVLVIKNQAHSELKTERLKACKKMRKSAEKSKQKKRPQKTPKPLLII